MDGDTFWSLLSRIQLYCEIGQGKLFLGTYLWTWNPWHSLPCLPSTHWVNAHEYWQRTATQWPITRICSRLSMTTLVKHSTANRIENWQKTATRWLVTQIRICPLMNTHVDHSACWMKPKICWHIYPFSLLIHWLLSVGQSNYYFCRAENPGVVCASKTQNLLTLSWKSSFTKG